MSNKLTKMLSFTCYFLYFHFEGRLLVPLTVSLANALLIVMVITVACLYVKWLGDRKLETPILQEQIQVSN